MRKRDRQAMLTVLLNHDCAEPDVALRELVSIVDRAIDQRVKPLKRDIAHFQGELRYLVDQDAAPGIGIGIEREGR